MTARTRSRSRIIAPSGTAHWLSSGSIPDQNTPARLYNETCVDEVDGTRNAHSLHITKSSNLLYTVYGWSQAEGQTVNAWRYLGWTKDGNISHVPASTAEPSDNTTFSRTLARSNPARPNVDLPVFLYELKDIPHQIREWGKRVVSLKGESIDKRYGSLTEMPRRTGELYLEWEFAIKPLMSDLWKMMQFVGGVEKKLRQLRNLQRRGSTGGMAVVWDDVISYTVGPVPLTPFYMEGNKITYRVQTQYKKWGTCVWHPSVELPQTDDALMMKAFQLSFGLDLSLATLWEVLPWSWLVDWFSNVGDLVAIHRNSLPVDYANSCVMKSISTRVIDMKKTSGNGVFSLIPNPHPVRVEKHRTPTGLAPIPEFNIPFLDGRQLGILGSLAVTKNNRRLVSS